MGLFSRKNKTRRFHVVASGIIFGKTRFISATMSLEGAGKVQQHIVNNWREQLMKDAGAMQVIILNFIEIEV